MMQRFIFFLLLTFTAFGVKSQAGTTDAPLKAAFIFNFTSYIEWNDNNESSFFIIGILGPSGIESPLNEIAKTKMVKNRSIVIKQFSSPENIEYCNILFIPQKTTFPLQLILNNVNRATLTVSEEPGFAKQGTAFNFILQNERLKFEANLKTIYNTSLKVSSQLLKLAIIVDQQ